MALAGRTWAQIASGLPASPCIAPEPIPKGIPPAAAIAPRQGEQTKMGMDLKTANKARDVEQLSADQVEPNESAPKDEVPVWTRAVAAPGAVAQAAVRTATPEDVAKSVGTPKSVGKRAQNEMAAMAPRLKGVFEVVSVSRVDDGRHSSDLSSTAASDRDGCIVCGGSGLLCSGLLKDPCPLCEPHGDAIGDEIAEALGGTTVSDGPETDAPTSEVEQTESIGAEEPFKEEGSRSGAEDTDEQLVITEQIGLKAATGMTAPPGIGPPGVWVWANDSKPSQPEDKTVNWPEEPVNSVEVEFIGKVAQACFGSDFKKMTVSWDEPWVQGESTMSKVNVEVHLEPMPPVYLDFLAPLVRLQSVLARDQALHQCRIFRMSCSEDNATMDLSCAMVGHGACWDLLKKGFCPRPGCTWEHPVPTLLNVTWTGGPELHLGSDDELVLKLPLSTEKSSFGLNIAAFESDDSSDDSAYDRLNA